VTVEAWTGDPPLPAPDVVAVATSCHPEDAFYVKLSEFSSANPKTHCILVDDGEGGEATVAALSSGVQPHIILADDGLQKVLQVGRRLLRESWLAHVATA
jgi:serine/threonine protein phosphatase PrpC